MFFDKELKKLEKRIEETEQAHLNKIKEFEEIKKMLPKKKKYQTSGLIPHYDTLIEEEKHLCELRIFKETELFFNETLFIVFRNEGELKSVIKNKKLTKIYEEVGIKMGKKQMFFFDVKEFKKVHYQIYNLTLKNSLTKKLKADVLTFKDIESETFFSGFTKNILNFFYIKGAK